MTQDALHPSLAFPAAQQAGAEDATPRKTAWTRRRVMKAGALAAFAGLDTWGAEKSVTSLYHQVIDSPQMAAHVQSKRETADNLIVDLTLDLRLMDKDDGKDNRITVKMHSGEERFFKRLNVFHDRKTGAWMGAFREVDAQGNNLDRNLRVVFHGREKKGEWRATPQAAATVRALLEGNPSPQFVSVEHYMEKELIPAIGAEMKANRMEHDQYSPAAPMPALSLHFYGPSAGAGNALYAKYQLLKQQKKDSSLPSPEILFYEPFAAGHAVMDIVRHAVGYENGVCKDNNAACDLLASLRSNATTVRAIPETPVAAFALPFEASNKQFGEHVFVLNASDAHKSSGDLTAAEDKAGKEYVGAGVGIAGTPMVDRGVRKMRGQVPSAAQAGARLLERLHLKKRKPDTAEAEADAEILANPGRRILLERAASALRIGSTGLMATAAGSWAGGEIAKDTNWDFHSEERPLELLLRVGEKVLEVPRDKKPLLASDDDITNPKKNPLFTLSPPFVSTAKARDWAAGELEGAFSR